jgi:hypothetical protein
MVNASQIYRCKARKERQKNQCDFHIVIYQISLLKESTQLFVQSTCDEDAVTRLHETKLRSSSIMSHSSKQRSHVEACAYNNGLTKVVETEKGVGEYEMKKGSAARLGKMMCRSVQVPRSVKIYSSEEIPKRQQQQQPHFESPWYLANPSSSKTSYRRSRVTNR